MAIGDPERDDVVIERRRTAVIALVAMAIVLFMLASGGALGWGAALASGASLTALTGVYLAAAGATDGRRRAVTGADGAPKPSFAIDESARVVLDALPDPVIIVRKGGRVEAINAAARRELGVAAIEPTLAALLREPRVLDAVEAALDEARSGDVEFKDASGRDRYLRALVAPFRAGVDERARAVVVIRDETAVKRSEMARADFLANASHELKTPLASLAGFIETLGGHARDDEAARNRFLGIMSMQAERMRRLINDLLSLARIEQTEHVEPTETLDLATLAGDVADALGPLVAEKGLVVTVRPYVETARVLGDHDELLQVIQNLVDNAVKYSEAEGRVLVEIGVADDADAAAAGAEPLAPDAPRLTLLDPAAPWGRPFAWVRVTDQGPGIERRHLPRLTERFYRGDSDEAASKEGTGLGLAIVRHVMARHRGGLTVESAAGVGSRFTVYAPLYEDAASGDATARLTDARHASSMDEAPRPRAEGD